MACSWQQVSGWWCQIFPLWPVMPVLVHAGRNRPWILVQSLCLGSLLERGRLQAGE